MTLYSILEIYWNFTNRNLLLSLEEKKEGLGIELIYFSDVEKEIEQLGLAMAGQTDTSETHVASTEMDQHFAELATMYKQKRISLVNDYLRTMNDSTLIFTSQSNPDAIGNVGSVPKFEVNYSLCEYNEGNPDTQ